jgi:hypothetical protein
MAGDKTKTDFAEKGLLDLVDLWLGLLLGDTGCVVSRQLSCTIDFSVDFYDLEARHQGSRSGIWIVELARIKRSF